ncbi:MAG: TIGR02186 family protein [Pseudomonadota bacterium]
MTHRLATLTACLLIVLMPFFTVAQAVDEPDDGGNPEGTRERVVASLSQSSVGITATFSGSEIFVFGAVDRDRLADERDDDLDVIVSVIGPEEPALVRRKSRQLGIWVNSATVTIDSAPSFYAIATTGPLREILSDTSDLRHRISIDRAVRVVGEASNVDRPADFAEAIVRLRRAAGVYFEQIDAVKVTERKLFQTAIALPANIIEGDYEARVYILREGRVIDDFATGIEVRKVGLERWIYTLAQEQSLIYGILSILVALLAGWGASEIFRLLRR